MTIKQSLHSLSAYPIPSNAIENICGNAGISPDTQMTDVVRADAGYKKAVAHAYLWLAEAPNISQGGISYSFGDEERRRYRNRASALLAEVGSDSEADGCGYGYVGSDL